MKVRIKLPVLLEICLVRDDEVADGASASELDAWHDMASFEMLEHVNDYLARVLAGVAGYRVVGTGSVAGKAFCIGSEDEVLA